MRRPRPSLMVSLAIHAIAALTLLWAAFLSDGVEIRELRVDLQIEEAMPPEEEVEDEVVEREDPIEEETFEEPKEIEPEFVDPPPIPEPKRLDPLLPERKTHWTELRHDLMRRTKPKPPPPKPKPKPKPRPKPKPQPVVARLPEAIPGKNKQPDYPKLALRRKWMGKVTLLIVVDEGGKVQKCTVAKSSGYEILDDAAKSAVLGWTFRYGPGTTRLVIEFVH